MTDGNFDRTELAQIQSEISKQTKNPIIGEVTQVYEHLGEDDDSNFEVDVKMRGGTEEEQRIPVENPGSGAVDVPKNGDKVIINYRKNGSKPYVSEIAYSTQDRPPVGKAGMWRREFISALESQGDNTPTDQGSLFVTGYTKYDGNVASEDKDSLVPQESLVRLAKRENKIADPTKEDFVPAKVELYDSPKDDESHITIEIQMEDGNTTDATWGLKFDIKQGTFTLVDPDGFGIEANGNGDFTWHHKSIDFNEVSGDTGPLSL